MNPFKSILFLISFATLIGCDSANEKKVSISPRVKNISKVDAPKNGINSTIGDTLVFSISSNDADIAIDSVQVIYNGKNVISQQSIWNTINETPGKKTLTISVFLSNGTIEKKRHFVTLLSDIEPVRYTYRITNTYIHDPDAFTQGLLIDNSKLYESTGEKGQSTLRQVELKTGKVLQSIDIASQYFGEGIGLLNENIYMLSWKERTGFVFNKNSFELVRQFSYPTEGWGLTSNGVNLIMSDGTHMIYFMEPESFSEIKRIEVYDQNGPIDFLNELEYINGDLFAVRWQTEQIYIIEPNSGKVKGILDLKGIFDFSTYDKRHDVLNGIAYDKNLDRYYITGKWWPKLFEIQLVAAANNL
ncbi:MAG: glutaminyl-peptide cyclotransferase [Reichenbachiella sp.]|uniref:glutaminyl-peptide cyclotransferase n=1 Tax=Reichenbachiella sp. TaxID=2184521 RepID=UPI0032979B75